MAGCFLCAIRRFAHLDVCCARILLKYLPINDKPMIDPKRDFIPLTQNYDRLKAYQKSECIYDVTYYFAHRFLGRGDRTVDQMVQAARSGKQNIAEGVEAGATSCETAIKLVNVARASLQECGFATLTYGCLARINMSNAVGLAWLTMSPLFIARLLLCAPILPSLTLLLR